MPLDRRSLVTQNPAAASLARISHRQPGFTSYIYDSSAGAGSWVYVTFSRFYYTRRAFPPHLIQSLDTFFPLELILDIRISGEGLPMATMAYLVRRMMM